MQWNAIQCNAMEFALGVTIQKMSQNENNISPQRSCCIVLCRLQYPWWNTLFYAMQHNIAALQLQRLSKTTQQDLKNYIIYL